MTFLPPPALGVLSVEGSDIAVFSAAVSSPTPGLRPAYLQQYTRQLWSSRWRDALTDH